MSGEVVAIHGGVAIAPAEVDATFVETMEKLLEAVRSGEIVAVAWASQYRDESATWRTAGTFSSPFRVIGALETAKYSLVKEQVS